ncbi:zinc-binding dehydrogenase [Corynebacterium caspium]|uniref:zinc-binding dehydrogenase n=1 Tax=Corynebacterium caspium TaxID=234828 RepID=UPI000378CBB9|nr:zinc-binding dehydrogenase [Corynebacterium caspium]WKD59259.1 Zinc-binding dehydrogenase [Corynebacterium caspium DSM 44850]
MSALVNALVTALAETLVEVEIIALRADRLGDGIGIVVSDPLGAIPPGAQVLFYDASFQPAETSAMAAHIKVRIDREKLVATPHGVNQALAAAIMHEAIYSHVLLNQIPHTCVIAGINGLQGLVLTTLAVELGSGVLVVAEDKEAMQRALSIGVAETFDSPGFPVAKLKKATANLGVDTVFLAANTGLVSAALKVVRESGTLCLVAPQGDTQDRIAAAALYTHGSAAVRCPSIAAAMHTAAGYREHAQAVMRWLEEGLLDGISSYIQSSTVPAVEIFSTEFGDAALLQEQRIELVDSKL